MIVDLKTQQGGIRWANPDSIHLTLKFLGELTPDEVKKLFSGMDVAQQKFPDTFSLKSGQTGCFPSCKRPRVLWVGVKGEEMDSLHVLQRMIDKSLQEQGFPVEDRKFSPHLTVARIKFGNPIEVILEKFIKYPFPEITLPVKEIHIMRSDLKPNGAVYSVQKTYKLKEV